MTSVTCGFARGAHEIDWVSSVEGSRALEKILLHARTATDMIISTTAEG